jgi:hypothetical protein
MHPRLPAENCRARRRFTWILSLGLAATGAPGRLAAHEPVTYEANVRPLLTRSCGGKGCHINEVTSGAEFTSYEKLMASSGEQYGSLIVLPGKPDESPLIDKVQSAVPRFGDRMPFGGEPLAEHEIALLRRWILEGAVKSHFLLRGDANGDDHLNITDAVVILSFLFVGGVEPACLLLADADGNGTINLTDAIFVLNHLFLGGPGPERLTQAENAACIGKNDLSFTSIYEKIFARSCAFSSCHSAEGQKGGLSLASREEAHANLVGVRPFNEAALAGGWWRVAPGDPGRSFLLRKLTEPGAGEGNRMPSNSPVPLSEATIAAIREWILAGAPLEGTIAGVPDISDEPPPPVDGIPQPPVPENGIQLHLPPFTIGPGREREVFYYLEKPFAAFSEDVIVQRIDIHMSEHSHHFIVYEWRGAQNPPQGFRDIGGVSDIITQRRFILGSQQSFFTLAFPPGVGLKFSKDTSFDFNSHYVNLNNEQPLMGEVYVNIFFAPPGSITTFVKPIFDINFQINVPPNQTRTTTAIFPSSTQPADPAFATNGRVLRETHVYSISSHMHRHGVRFQVFLTQNGVNVDPPRRVYDNFDWDDPVYTVFDPPLVLQPGQGLRYEATHFYHDPPTPNSPPLTFGLTSEDEMAILLGYYAVP